MLKKVLCLPVFQKKKAEEFLDYMEGGIIEIKVDKGKKGVYIGEDAMSYKQEDEVLFGNGEVLYIEKVDKKNNKVIAKMK